MAAKRQQVTSLKFCSLGSGSGGNATLVESGETLLLIDNGFNAKHFGLRWAERCGDRPMSDISAILVTHEHGDHSRGVNPLARKHRIPVYASTGTAAGSSGFSHWHCVDPHQSFEIGDITVEPFPVVHDAREPCQYVFDDGEYRIAVVSDLGCVTPHVQDKLSTCDFLLLEANHDPEMLRVGPYPWALKQRVGGDVGHLANHQTASLLKALPKGKLKGLIATHISEKNNTPALVKETLAPALEWPQEWIQCATQDSGFDWKALPEAFNDTSEVQTLCSA